MTRPRTWPVVLVCTIVLTIRWAREFWEAMQPFVEPSVYVNDLGEEGDERVRAAYGPNYERLVTLKSRYDPTNFFRLNQNVAPTAQHGMHG